MNDNCHTMDRQPGSAQGPLENSTSKESTPRGLPRSPRYLRRPTRRFFCGALKATRKPALPFHREAKSCGRFARFVGALSLAIGRCPSSEGSLRTRSYARPADASCQCLSLRSRNAGRVASVSLLVVFMSVRTARCWRQASLVCVPRTSCRIFLAGARIPSVGHLSVWVAADHGCVFVFVFMLAQLSRPT